MAGAKRFKWKTRKALMQANTSRASLEKSEAEPGFSKLPRIPDVGREEKIERCPLSEVTGKTVRDVDLCYRIFSFKLRHCLNLHEREP